MRNVLFAEKTLLKVFVSEFVAKKLKEIGFTKLCVAVYSKDLKGKSILYLTEPCFKNSYKDDKRLAAPLYSQVFDWARDEHNLYPEITLDSFKEPYELKVTIHHLDKSNSFVDTAYYPYSNGIPGMSNKLYNEAEKKAVRLLIKIINNK